MRSVILVTLAAAAVMGLALAALHGYAAAQLVALGDQTAYATPEDGMRALAADHYVGLDLVKIVHAGNEPCFLANLCFVEARVWADGRSDGRMLDVDGDNPGALLLRRPDGFVWVREEQLPWLVAFDQQLFGRQ